MRVEDFQKELIRSGLSSTFQNHSLPDEESWVLDIHTVPEMESFGTLQEQVERQLTILIDEGMKCFVLNKTKQKLTLLALSSKDSHDYLTQLQEILFQLKITLSLFEDVPEERDELSNSVPVLQENPLLIEGYQSIETYLNQYQHLVYGWRRKEAPLMEQHEWQAILGSAATKQLSPMDAMTTFLEEVPEYKESHLKKSLDEWMMLRNRLDYLATTCT